MNYTVVINGCSPTYPIQIENMTAFMRCNLDLNSSGNSIIFYDQVEEKEALIAASPTPELHLIRIDRYQPEIILAILQELETNRNRELYLFPGDYAGSELAPRLAFRIGGSSMADIVKIKPGFNEITCYKEVYSSYLRGSFTLHEKPYCISILRNAPREPEPESSSASVVLETDMRGRSEDHYISELEFTAAASQSRLSDTGFLIAAGRGVKNRGNTEKLHSAARELGAEFGISRPVAMSAWAPLDRLVGVSGTITRPKICIAVAVSGAAAFYAGIENSNKIIAINLDEKAPIVQAADVAVIEDYEAILDELLKIVRRGD